MSNPKRHHFVPKAYLKGFVDESSDFLHVYSKREGKWRKQKPKEVMVRNKYYHQDWAPDGVDKNILEKRLGSTIEPLGLLSLNKLINTPEELNDDDSANIIMYLQFQRIRVPRQADMAKSLAKTALELYLSQTPIGKRVLDISEVIIKDSFRINFMRTVSGALTPYFSRMIWELIHAPESTSFVTSDSPVSFYNVAFVPPAEAGIGLYGTIVFFPLNKSNLLLMRHREYEEKLKEATDRLPHDLNYEDGLIELRKDITWSSDSVQKLNWTMLMLSQDIIVGDSKKILEGAILNDL